MTDISQTNSPSRFERVKRRVMSTMLHAWRGASGQLGRYLRGGPSPALTADDQAYLTELVQRCLDPATDRHSARRHEQALRDVYWGLADKGKVRFMRLLARHFDVDDAALLAAADDLRIATTPMDRVQARKRLRSSLESPRALLFQHLVEGPSGIELLLDMRSILLSRTTSDPELTGVEDDLHHLLASLFNVGLLDLQEVDWESPAALLERLMEYERVHPMQSWSDLKHRLATDRRIFALFHHRLPEEPLIFVQVALMAELPARIDEVLAPESAPLKPEAARCAVFYSISSTQRGLAGIQFGNYLIKQATERICREMPQIKTVATLSPIPGFARWLNDRLNAPESLLTAADGAALSRLAAADGEAADRILARLLQDAGWQADSAICEVLRPIMLRLCAHYLLCERRNGRAHDPVAHFHLSNGARLARVNWLANRSDLGMRQAHGMMVNYHYQLDHVDENRDGYVSAGDVAAARSVRQLLS